MKKKTFFLKKLLESRFSSTENLLTLAAYNRKCNEEPGLAGGEFHKNYKIGIHSFYMVLREPD